MRALSSLTTHCNRVGCSLYSGDVNPGMIIGGLEALIIPAGILGPALWIYERNKKEEEYSKDPTTEEARAYFARKEEIVQVEKSLCSNSAPSARPWGDICAFRDGLAHPLLPRTVR